MIRTLTLTLALFSATATSADDSPLLAPALVTTAQELMEHALKDDLAYATVESLTTEIGPRLAGTEAEARARAWAVSQLKDLGFSNVRVEPFEVPLWRRGIERAEITTPYPQALTVTALGGSVSTGEEGVEGEIVRFSSLAELKSATDNSHRGKIVFVDEAMTRTQDGSGYGAAVGKRRETAYQSLRVGAKGALIRSVGTSSHRFAHTGQMRRAIHAVDPSVPTAALSAPDAEQLTRALSRGKPVSVKLILTPQSLPATNSGNVIAEIPGREAPDEIILVGAHLDSWDLGTGAIDDGAGVGIVIGASKLLMEQLPQGPRRTIRIVLFGAEEVGLVGAKAYAEQHADELAQHIIGTESDFGASNIWQFETRVAEQKLPLARAIGAVLRPLGIGPGPNKATGGPDMLFMREAGMPVVTLKQNGWDYFDLHHTPNDTLDKIDPALLAQNVAAYAAFLYLVAEIEEDFR